MRVLPRQSASTAEARRFNDASSRSDALREDAAQEATSLTAAAKRAASDGGAAAEAVSSCCASLVHRERKGSRTRFPCKSLSVTPSASLPPAKPRVSVPAFSTGMRNIAMQHKRKQNAKDWMFKLVHGEGSGL